MSSNDGSLFSADDTLLSAGGKVGCAGIVIGFAAAISLPGIFLCWAADGVVISYYWDWFIVPTFSVSSLGIVKSIGVIMTLRYILASHDNNNFDKFKKSRKESLVKKEENENDSLVDYALFYGTRFVIVPFFAICLGWLFKHFVFGV